MKAPWSEYFLDIADYVAKRATCPRAAVGAVLVVNRQIISTGYNGSPRKTAHCDDIGCLLDDGHCVRSTHAEINAIAQAARVGGKLDGAICYCTLEPCRRCTNALINAGVVEIIFRKKYGVMFDETAQLCVEAGVIFRQRS